MAFSTDLKHDAGNNRIVHEDAVGGKALRSGKDGIPSLS